MEPQREPVVRIVTTISSAVLSDENRRKLTSSCTGCNSAAQLLALDNTRVTLYVTSDVESSSKTEGASTSQIPPRVKKSHSLPEMGPHSDPRQSIRSSWCFVSAPSPTHSASPTTPKPGSRASSIQPRQKILFYNRHEPYFNLTNFSPHTVEYKGKVYPTSEHLFQAMKFLDHRPEIADRIRTLSSRPSVAFSEARRFQSQVRKDWKSMNIRKMDEVLWLKFTQHPDLRAELLSTGNAELVEDSDKDSFWGIGANRDGRNELGKALERLRTNLSLG